ncbi:uncharacterized protein LOC127850902 [Dreissena polymorpha]|uniref:Uncharacterized protein n=1 Tax=Dreissena polymorpha TaxID=45954 RepID=A0A9D4DA36_DREPO|nr:uncharacterized protein LOC127850902 [Dreissena polymorpha]KAH3740937.1 hypothetical protein DPMN_047654 [Dreissena polymorpha]
MIPSLIVLIAITKSCSVKADATELPYTVSNRSLEHVNSFLCPFNENITFTITNLESNNETILAECDMLTKVCSLMSWISETQFTVKYANPGGILTINNHSEDKNVSYTCYHSFNTTGQKELIRYSMQNALRGNYNVSTDNMDQDGRSSFLGGLSYTGTVVVISLTSVLVVAFIVGTVLRASMASSKRYRHVRSWRT